MKRSAVSGFRLTVAVLAVAAASLAAGVPGGADPTTRVTIQELPPPAGGLQSFAHGANQTGVVAGWSEYLDIAQRPTYSALVWLNRAPFTLPSPPAATDAQGLGINDVGTVAGLAQIGGVLNSALWQGHNVQLLGNLPGGTFSVAVAVNRWNRVVGYGDNASGAERGILWDRGNVTPLQPLVGSSESEAHFINAHGDAIGLSVGDFLNPEHQHAALWASGGPP